MPSPPPHHLCLKPNKAGCKTVYKQSNIFVLIYAQRNFWMCIVLTPAVFVVGNRFYFICLFQVFFTLITYYFYNDEMKHYYFKLQRPVWFVGQTGAAAQSPFLSSEVSVTRLSRSWDDVSTLGIQPRWGEGNVTDFYRNGNFVFKYSLL